MREQTHYYILPDGTRVENMKEACEALKVNRRSFQNLVKKEIVNKVLISKLQKDEQTNNSK